MMVPLKFCSEPPFFFFKMAAILQKFQLCPISMKIYILGYIDVANMMVPSKFCSRATIFFSKWLSYRQNFNFVRFQWKLISWGILMWRTWWYHQNVVLSHHLFSKWPPYRKNFNFVQFQWKIDILGYIDVTIMMVLWIFFFEIVTILYKGHLCPILRKNYSFEGFDVVNMMVLSKQFSELSIFFQNGCHVA